MRINYGGNKNRVILHDTTQIFPNVTSYNVLYFIVSQCDVMLRNCSRYSKYRYEHYTGLYTKLKRRLIKATMLMITALISTAHSMSHAYYSRRITD